MIVTFPVRERRCAERHNRLLYVGSVHSMIHSLTLFGVLIVREQTCTSVVEKLVTTTDSTRVSGPKYTTVVKQKFGQRVA